MSDEVVQGTTNSAVDPEQTGERARRSRKRGKRNRSKSGDAAPRSPSESLETTGAAATMAPAPPRERERSGRRGGRERAGGQGFADGLDRFFCITGRLIFPLEWPVSHRHGLAISRAKEVDRRDGELLLCDQLHEGTCVWPDGVPVAAPPSTDSEGIGGDDAPHRSTPMAEQPAVVDADA